MEANPAPGLPLGPQTQTQTHHPRGYNSSRVLVNPNQRGNKMLDSILKVPWEYADIGADYQVGRDAVALFLSLKYHRLKPEYIYTRMKTLAHALRIVLCVVDVEDHQQPIRELTRACIVAGYTLVLAWSLEEAGRYVETFKAFEFKSPDLIKEKVVGDAFTKVSECLVQIKSVNKTDALTLVSTFGTFRSIVQATPDELSTLPGFGDQKVRRFVEAVNSPFLLESGKAAIAGARGAASSSATDRSSNSSA